MYRLMPLVAVALITVAGLRQSVDAREQSEPTRIGTASLSGTVVVAGAGPSSPLRRARITVQSDAGGSAQTNDTDIDGRFRVGHLAAGAYRVTVEKAGFVPLGRITAVTIANAQAATVAITMQHAAALEGRIIGEDGEPVAGFTVSAIRLGFGPYGKRPIAVRQAVTDDLGRFRVHTLLSGEYYIEAAPDPRRQTNPPPAPGSPRPARTYFPGTPRLNQARAVVVTAGQDASNLDFTLGSATVANISGRVVMSSGKLPASFGVRFQRVGAAPGEVLCSVFPQDNQFQCSNAPPGDYWLLSAARSSPTSDVEFAATTVTVAGQNIANLSVTTAPGVSISGRIEVEGGAPLPANTQVAALETEYELPLPNPASPSVLAVPPVPAGADGTFAFPASFGARLVRPVRLPDGWAVKRVMLGETDITDTPTTFTRTDTPPVVRVVLAPHAGTIGGTVTDQASHSAGGSRVVVFADDPRLWSARSRFIKTVEAGADGRYSVSGLLPGKYFVVAVDSLDDGTWEDPDVLARLQPFASPIVVSGTETQTRDLKRMGGL